jgi:hypothetical protein
MGCAVAGVLLLTSRPAPLRGYGMLSSAAGVWAAWQGKLLLTCGAWTVCTALIE